MLTFAGWGRRGGCCWAVVIVGGETVFGVVSAVVGICERRWWAPDSVGWWAVVGAGGRAVFTVYVVSFVGVGTGCWTILGVDGGWW